LSVIYMKYITEALAPISVQNFRSLGLLFQKRQHRDTSGAVVVMRCSRTASCRASLNVNRVLLGQST